MDVLRIAHRAGNDLTALAPALALGADVLEADVHLRDGRLEVRHARTLGPVPWLWEGWSVLRDPMLRLHHLQEVLPSGSTLMLDLKGSRPDVGRQVREAMGGSPPYVVCGRSWAMLEVFADDPDVRVVHSVGSRWELRHLPGQLRAHRTWGLSVHRDLLTARRVAWMRTQAEVVMTWEVDHADVYEHVVGLGVNGVISNDLAALPPRRRAASSS